MAAVLVQAPDQATLKMVRMCRCLYEPVQGPRKKQLSRNQVYLLNKRFAQAYMLLQTTIHKKPDVQALFKEVIEYDAALSALGLEDFHVGLLSDEAGASCCSALCRGMYNLLVAVVFFLLAAPFYLLMLPAFLLIDYKAREKAKAALAGGKAGGGMDVLASWKFLYALAIFPLEHLVLVTAVAVVVSFFLHGTIFHFAWSNPLWERLAIILGVLFLFPLLCRTAGVLMRSSSRHSAKVRPLFRAACGPMNAQVSQLSVWRQQLVGKVRTAVERYGPETMPGFEETRVVRRWSPYVPQDAHVAVTEEVIPSAPENAALTEDEPAEGGQISPRHISPRRSGMSSSATLQHHSSSSVLSGGTLSGSGRDERNSGLSTDVDLDDDEPEAIAFGESLQRWTGFLSDDKAD